MQFAKRFWTILACAALALSVVTIAPAAADQGAYPKTEAELQAAYDALQWRSEANSFALSRSHATIRLSGGKFLLLGADAQRYSWLVSGIEFPDTEAVLSGSSEESAEVYYEWRDEGYVSDSDWEDVDADALLKEYTEATEASNAERAENGFAPMHVVGWLQPPSYDAATRTVTYALELKDDESSWANAVALRLGRAGYTELTWVGSVAALRNSGNRPALMQTALDIHAFDEGYRYTDFQEGDKVAAYGIGGLLATALGLKFGKGFIAAAIAFVIGAKKIVIPLAVVLVGVVIAGVRKFLGRSAQS